MADAIPLTTAEQLLHAHDLGRCELIRGELRRMEFASFDHGRVVARIAATLGAFVESQSTGEVVCAGTGFVLARNPDTVRAPDVGFIRAARLPPSDRRGFFEGPPDLAVEALSPDDRPNEVNAKIHDWLTAGSRAVWVIDPDQESATVNETGAAPQTFHRDDTLVGGELLPGFTVRVADLFARPQ